MATTNSVEYQNILDCAAGARDPNPARDQGGRKRTLAFSKTAAGEGTGDDIALTKVPKGAKITAIRFCSDVIGSAAGTAFTVGDDGDVDRLVATVTVGTSAQAYAGLPLRTPGSAAGATVDVGFGYVYTADTVIKLYVDGAALAGSGDFFGEIEYTLD